MMFERKKMRSRIILTVSVLLVTALACASPVSLVPSEPVSDQGVQPAVPSVPSATPFIAESYPTAGAEGISPNQLVSGIDVRVDRAWQAGKQVYADVCYTIPDASDWTIWKASLRYTDVVLQEYGATLLSSQEPTGDGQPGLRCDTLEFYVPPDADLSIVTVSVEAIGSFPRQEDYCTIYMPKIQQTLNERGVAIALECSNINGVETMQIASKPDSISQEEAEQLVYSDEFFTITGPWEFTFNLTQ
jgi:hypothetical protein